MGHSNLSGGRADCRRVRRAISEGNLKRQLTRDRLLASFLLCGAAALGGALPAHAQSKAPASSEVGEIVVTGTRIRQPNLTSVSPVQTVTAQQVQLGGRPQTIDILNQLPQVTQVGSVDLGPTSDALSGPGGVATVDLRGLGPQRTLVLVDGRRLGVGDPNTGNPNPAPDINQIPSQLIDRIDVVTGGASATYGSDAIAGVVNFVMKHNFQGVQMDVQAGVYQHNQQNDYMQKLEKSSNNPVPGSRWDGRSKDFSVLFGMNAPDGRGNVTGYATYTEQAPVTQRQRDYTGCQLKVSAAGVGTCSGSSNSNIFYAADNSGGTFAVKGSDFVDYGTAGTSPPAIFNANPYEYLIQQNKRYSAGFFANYKINNHAELYSNFGAVDSVSNVNVGPTALFQGSGVTPSGGFLINCNNPLLSASEVTGLQCSAADVASGATKDTYIGRRNIEGGPRNAYYDHSNYRVVLGAKGDIFGPWKYDAYASYYSTTLATRIENYFSIKAAQDALLVGGTAANPVCLSGNPNCVPYNIFKDGGVTPAAAASLAELGTASGTTTQRILEADINGDLGAYGIKSPFANHGVAIAFGASSRKDFLSFSPDAAEESGDLSGAGGASVKINKTIVTKEAYGEVNVPLVEDMPFIKALNLQAGYRYSDYSTGIIAHTYKLGGDWAPVDDIRFRISYNRAIRAPNLLELYTPQSVTNTSDVSDDPCAAGSANPATAAQCANTGVTAAQYGHIPNCPANQCAVLTGGNPVLKPESADTYSVGFTARPRFVPGFTASVDYYRIELENEVGSIPLDVAFNNCLTTGNPTFCSLIKRNPSNGTIFGTVVGGGGYIVGTNVNVGAGENSGIDFQAAYKLPLADWGLSRIGKVALDLNGSLLLKNLTTPLPGDPTYDCTGLFGPNCGTTLPKWRSTVHVNWTMPWADATLSLAWRYVGGAEYEDDSDQPTIGGSTPNKFNHTIPAVNYFDLAGIWRVNDTLGIRAGVNNVFDKDPPLLPNAIVGGANPNTYQVYDLLGRRIFLGVTANF
jgi:iron complex outermembrane receptor protein